MPTILVFVKVNNNNGKEPDMGYEGMERRSGAVDPDLCIEKHRTVDRRLGESKENDEKLFSQLADLVKTINGKFTKVFIMFITVLLTIIGGLIVTIVTRK